MSVRNNRKRGQALVMVALAALAMFGIVGLAVDLGWAFYVKRSAQAAADAAALAAVRETLEEAGTGTYTCGTGNVVCWTTPQPCPSTIVEDPTNNLDNGCLYAERNGFKTGGNGGHQLVTLQSNNTSPPPTAPGVTVFYWVTARVSENIPQLLSRVLGRSQGTSSARATAAIAEVVTIGSLVLLDGENDPRAPKAKAPEGTNLYIGGGAVVNVPGGILLASTSTKAGDFGGEGLGRRAVHTPFTYIQGSGGHGGLPESVRGAWDNWYTNQSDSALFQDPFAGKGQPPLTTRTLNAIPVIGGQLSESICPGWVCPEGVYFATDVAGNATGAPIVVPGKATMRFNAGGFGDFTFFGGLKLDSGGVTVDFGPGRYTLAGQNQGVGEGSVFSTANAATVTGGGMAGETLIDAGRLFILTDSAYPGLASHLASVDSYLASAGARRLWDHLNFGTSDFKAGENSKSSLSLYGIDKTKIAAYTAEANAQGYTLQDFGNITIWQDQRNSNIRYNPDGTYDTSCPDVDVCWNEPLYDRTMSLTANQKSRLEGIVYQPRGADVEVWAGTGYSGPITLISGALTVWGSGELTLAGSVQPLTRRTVALVE